MRGLQPGKSFEFAVGIVLCSGGSRGNPVRGSDRDSKGLRGVIEAERKEYAWDRLMGIWKCRDGYTWDRLMGYTNPDPNPNPNPNPQP